MLNEQRIPPTHLVEEASWFFRHRFGPEALVKLDGRALLAAMYGPDSRRETLTYWLSYKNDSELQYRFGELGPAHMVLDMGYNRSDGSWYGRYPREKRQISENEAVATAIQQRAALIEAVQVLSQFPLGAGPEQYEQLEHMLQDCLGPLSRKPWVHKYLTMLFPYKLDNYHFRTVHRFHLIKLWQHFPPRMGFYAPAGYYQAIAQQLGLPIFQLTSTLDQLHGRPYRRWVVRAEGTDWEQWVAHGFIGLGELGRYARNAPPLSPPAGRPISEDDLVIIMRGNEVVAIGKVTGDYKDDPRSAGMGRCPVKWLNVEPWFFPYPNHQPLQVLDDLRQPAIDLSIRAEQHADLEPSTVELSPPRIEQVSLQRLGRLQDFSMRFPVASQGTFDRLNLSVLVGENGTGKTTVLRFLTRFLNQPDQGTNYRVQFDVRGEHAVAAVSGREIKRPVTAPAKIIVSSYSAFEQYDLKAPPDSTVPYAYVGPGDEQSFAPTFLPILRASYHQDRTQLSTKEQERLRALRRLLNNTGCPEAPAAEFKVTPTFLAQPLPTEALEIDTPAWEESLPFPCQSESDLEAIRRVFTVMQRAPLFPSSPREHARHVTPTELRDYPGGAPMFVADLEVADKYHLAMIEDLWFPRGGELVALSLFSSGEMSLLYRFFRILREMCDDAVVIIDEPETHLHPRWILRFVRMVREVFGSYRAHVLLATHSPFIAADLPSSCIVSLRENAQTRLVESRQITEQTLATNPLQVLDEVFGVADYLGEFAQEHIERVRALIDAGKFDDAQEQLDQLGGSTVKFELYRRLDILHRRRRKK